jgi:hypothetical protein
MKKLLFAIGVLAFSFNASAQCDNYSTSITSSCGGTGCFFIEVRPTGILQVDNAIVDNTGGTFRRKLNQSEILAVLISMEENC